MQRFHAIAISLLVLLALAGATGSASAAFPSGAKVVRKDGSDLVRFVAAARGKSLGRPSTASDPRDVGRAFLRAHATDFGLRRGASLRAFRQHAQARGGAAVRYQQLIDGVEVMGGQFVVRMDAHHNVLSAQGEAEHRRPDLTPDLAARDAERAAIASVAKLERVHAARLDASGTELTIFNDALIGGPGFDRPGLGWATHVSDGFATKRLVVVDADTGTILVSIDESPEAKNRSVCDAGNAAAQLPCTAPVLNEGGTYGGAVADVQPAYDYSGATYDFLLEKFGRDSLDGNGMALKSTVRYCDPNYSCPFANAFWNGEQMVYGQGYAGADDVVGHELAHGYTEFTSGLFYYFQAGAINESMSDVIGELVDLETASPDGDTAANRWKMGESLPGGAIRDMEDPAQSGDPDSMVSPNWFLDPDMQDSGGVHFNSGVGNKAAYLMVDGGSFRGTTVTGIGADKTARIYDAVQTGFLTSGSDYLDLGLALTAACEGLVGTAGITATDCVQVGKAVTATAMLTERPEADDAEECPTGSAATYAHNESFESDTIFWDASLAGGQPSWSVVPGYATTGTVALYTPNASGSNATRSAWMTEGVAVPDQAFLSFQTAWEFEPPAYDGALVEISSDGGATWTDALPVSAYNGTIASGFGNPLEGRSGFVNRSNGYRRIVAPLGAHAGKTIVLRFVYGHDDLVEQGIGWIVDDIRILTCAAVQQAKPTVTSAAASDVAQTAATLNGTVNPNGSATTYHFEYGPNGTFTQSTAPVSAGAGTSAVSVAAPLTGLTAATSYSFRLVATNSGGTSTSAPSTFSTAADAPAPPTVTTLAATAVGPGTATLNGSVDPNGTETAVTFEVGLEPDLADARDMATPVSAGSGSTAQSHSLKITWTADEIPSGTTVYYRFVGVRDGVTRHPGSIVSFIATSDTGGAGAFAAPAVTTLGASGVAADGATVAGIVDPNGLQTTYYVEYGTGGQFTNTSSPVTIPAGQDPVSVSVALGGLSASTAYTYRLKAVNSMGEATGSPMTFTTAATGATTPDPIDPGPAAPVTPASPVIPASLKGTAKASSRRVKAAKVVCANRAAKVSCRVTFPGAKRKRKVSATLTSGAGTAARGSVRKANAKGLVTITGAKPLTAGTYRLTVKVGRKRYAFKLKLKLG